MYEGNILICQTIIEENWLEYLASVKKRAELDEQRNERRRKALAEIDAPDTRLGAINMAAEKSQVDGPSYRYYDFNLNGFWNWYIEHKL